MHLEPPTTSTPAPQTGHSLLAAVALAAAIIACSVYANLSLIVTDPAAYRFFPPFEPGVNANENQHLGKGTEYANIARSLVNGKGYANPFGRPTGPTAWMPPILPGFLAGLLWISNGSDAFVFWVIVVVQIIVLTGTGFLVLALIRQTTCRVAPAAAAAIFVAALLYDFRLAFQWTHDCWLVLVTIDLLIAGACWCGPLRTWRRAIAWGLLGGFCTLVNPIVGLAWGVLAIAIAIHERTWRRLVVAALVGGLSLVPWTAWNYWVFGRLIPLKSNLAFELYQSQCLQPDGLIRRETFSHHLGNANGREAKEYDAIGEIAYLDRKAERFQQAVRADPADFLDRVAARFMGATLWYVPFDPPQEARRPWTLWLSRLTHSLPFLALMVLVLFGIGDRLHRMHWIVIGVYLLYLLPYVVVSYYERYAFPLVGVKVVLVILAADRSFAFLMPLVFAKSREPVM